MSSPNVSVIFETQNVIKSNDHFNSNLLFTGSTVEAVGWGTTSYGGPVSSVLKKTSLGVISNAQCNSYYGYIQSGQLCTWASGRDSCQVRKIYFVIDNSNTYC